MTGVGAAPGGFSPDGAAPLRHSCLAASPPAAGPGNARVRQWAAAFQGLRGTAGAGPSRAARPRRAHPPTERHSRGPDGKVLMQAPLRHLTWLPPQPEGRGCELGGARGLA
jgi:hypothetical protein